MEKTNQLTTEQVIQETVRILGGIPVPVAMFEEIGQPIRGCMQNLVLVLQMMDAEKKAEEDDGRNAGA